MEYCNGLLEAAGFAKHEAWAEQDPHTSEHDGEEGLRSRIRGAWTSFPSLVAALPELEARESFGDALAAEYVARYEQVVRLENSLMVVTVESR